MDDVTYSSISTAIVLLAFRRAVMDIGSSRVVIRGNHSVGFQDVEAVFGNSRV